MNPVSCPQCNYVLAPFEEVCPRCGTKPGSGEAANAEEEAEGRFRAVAMESPDDETAPIGPPRVADRPGPRLVDDRPAASPGPRHAESQPPPSPGMRQVGSDPPAAPDRPWGPPPPPRGAAPAPPVGRQSWSGLRRLDGSAAGTSGATGAPDSPWGPPPATARAKRTAPTGARKVTRKQRSGAWGWVVIALVVVGLGAVALFARQQVVEQVQQIIQSVRGAGSGGL